MHKNGKCVISLSGGMDSSSLLIRMLSKNYDITAVSFDYGQKHNIEIEKSKELVGYLRNFNFSLKHMIINIKDLKNMLLSSLTTDKHTVPEGHYNESNMKLTVVPNRNKIFISMIQGIALSIANISKSQVIISMGSHAGDHLIYPDCRKEFYEKDYAAFLAGNWNAQLVKYHLPYLEKDKSQILKDGIKSCECLKINYREVYKRTFTSYIPITHDNIIYSDYKSASSIERIEAFIKIGKSDPISYANSEGPVTWEKAVNHAKGVLAKNQE